MSISIIDNFDLRAKKPDVARQLFNTIDEMVAFDENYLPDIYECDVIEDSTRYRYIRSNSIDEKLGKWRPKDSGDGSANLIDYYKKSETDTILEGYVKKEVGKGLSTNDFTTLEKEKLEELKNYDDTEVRQHITTSEQAISDIQNVIGNANLNTNAQNLSEAINEIKTSCDTSNSTLAERITKNETSIETLNGDETVDGSVSKKVKNCLDDSKTYTDQQIKKMSENAAIPCDSKPICSDDVITYVKEGQTFTTDNFTTWFYYKEDSKLMQTIFIKDSIDGSIEEKSVVSAGNVNFKDLVSKTNDIVSSYNGDEADTSKVPDLGAMKDLENKLKSDIDNRVKGDDIYDGLDSASTSAPLSANQGKVLDEKINTKLAKTFTGDNVANRPLTTDSLGNVILGNYDESLDSTSKNAVQNQVVAQEFAKKLDIQQDINKAGHVAVIGEDGNITFTEMSTLGGSAESISYSNESHPELTNVTLALNRVLSKLYYVEPVITSFTISPGTTEYEIGSTVNGLSFTWGLNKDVTSQILTDCTIEATDRSATYNSPITSNKTFTLTISDGENNTSASKTIRFLNKVYWGSSEAPSEYNNSFILGLSNNKLASSKNSSYQMTVGANEYGYLAVPTSFGSISTCWIGGFEVTLDNCGAISFTNASGHTSSYTIYKTGRTGLGSIKMEIK